MISIVVVMVAATVVTATYRNHEPRFVQNPDPNPAGRQRWPSMFAPDVRLEFQELWNSPGQPASPAESVGSIDLTLPFSPLLHLNGSNDPPNAIQPLLVICNKKNDVRSGIVITPASLVNTAISTPGSVNDSEMLHTSNIFADAESSIQQSEAVPSHSTTPRVVALPETARLPDVVPELNAISLLDDNDDDDEVQSKPVVTVGLDLNIVPNNDVEPKITFYTPGKNLFERGLDDITCDRWNLDVYPLTASGKRVSERFIQEDIMCDSSNLDGYPLTASGKRVSERFLPLQEITTKRPKASFVPDHVIPSVQSTAERDRSS